MESEQSSETSAKPRVPYACEACRISKVKCQPSTTSGLCRRCLGSKRECVFKTGPRTRRRRSKIHPAVTRKTPPPSAPSKTFTIDISMPAEDDAPDNFEALRESHEGFIDGLVPEDSGNDKFVTDDFSTPGNSFSLPPTSSSSRSHTTRSTHGFSSIQPQFNIDSASTLLASFREGMLPYFPVVVLPADTTVSSLAKGRPFVLLAILAAASGNRSLQGHSLYDEEFRKVLGLKFVSGGERSLELLVGLLIYCAWYPFHLRPKNKQAIQYIRMASDIVQDLEIDQGLDNEDPTTIREDAERMADIRAYLACYYASASFASTWGKSRPVTYQKWTATCCGILEANSEEPGDQILAWLVRLEHMVGEISVLRENQGKATQNEHHDSLVARGMEAQLQEWQSKIPLEASSTSAVTMLNLFTDFCLLGYPLLKMTSPKNAPGVPRQDPARLTNCASALRRYYDYMASLPTSEYSNFAYVDWGHLIISIILGLRLSFPIPSCPEWNVETARQVVELGSFLEKFSYVAPTLTPASSKPTDILSASRVVFGVVKRKYDKRIAAFENSMAGPPHPMPLDKSMTGRQCPMFDHSIDPFIQLWDDKFLNTDLSNPSLAAGFNVGNGAAGLSSEMQSLMNNDLWATMTMGWAQAGFGTIDFGNM